MVSQSLIDNPTKLYEFIENSLKPKQKEKQENGEVFTPLILIEELFDNLDKQYIEQNGESIFTKVDLKWADICGSGLGNFSIVLYLRLMNGLKVKIPNWNERKKYILENIIYMAEFNMINVSICREIFDVNNEYKLNIYQGDGLLLDTYDEWGVKQFDVILGNIPFNRGGIKSSSGKLLGNKNETIWPKFVEKSFRELKPNGYIVFIHPLSWLKQSHSVHNMLLEKYIISVKLWDNMKSHSVINGEIPISLYVLQNKLNTDKNKTLVISELLRRKISTKTFIFLDKKYSIPLAYHSMFHKLISFIENNNCKLDVKTKTVKSIGIKQPLTSIYTVNDNWGVDTYTIKDGIMVKKMIQPHPDTNKEKLIIANKSAFIGVFIDEGKLGITGGNNYYILGENLELLKKMFNFKIMNIISHYTKYGQDFLSSDGFSYIPDLRKMGYKNINEDEFYKLINV
jgi:hypothetical protein